MPIPISDDDADREFTSAAVARRLDRVVKILNQANQRLAEINTGFIDPPGPDEPAIVAALNSIKSEAGRAITAADQILGRLTR